MTKVPPPSEEINRTVRGMMAEVMRCAVNVDTLIPAADAPALTEVRRQVEHLSMAATVMLRELDMALDGTEPDPF